MADFAPIAMGLAGFMTGMAYAHRNCLAELRRSVQAGAVVVDARAYFLLPLRPDLDTRAMKPIEVATALAEGGAA